ncbi:Cupin domain-containing protein [Desulfacinum infernum DSM 9756]|uniref:Cupin domain-containing protein n=1 Tax=Desulfacinum infernum DSM 9756 TaxID=1121391 RepID=A0A1M4TKM3_9BACT|nr:cupin domain-containing protein [Desulfacinum infernum]SHE44978.1 Cupin domain-containing protein [Desulfacinum infernum DSM 9756]
MKIQSYKDVEPTVFDNDVAKGVAGRVLIGKEDGAQRFCMRFFELQPDGHTPRHTHDWEHEIFIHEGEGAVLKEGNWVPVRAGDAVFIPPNEDHQIKNTSEAPLRFICLIPSGPPEL